MKLSALKYTVLSWTRNLATIIILLVPFHAFLTVWLSSLIGHYTALRLWDEAVLMICALGVLYLWIVDHKIRSHTLSRRLVWVISVFIALNIVWGAIALTRHYVTTKALGYGLIVDLRFFVFFLVTWSIALRISRFRENWQWLIVWPAIIVIVFGLLQIFVLPHDFLSHFGYGPNTIPVAETINHNQSHQRIMSLLRGANPLGAYMIIPITYLAAKLTKPERKWRDAILFLAALIVLLFSFSRGAWIGAAISVAIIVFMSLKTKKLRQVSLIGAGSLVVVCAAIFIVFHNNTAFQDYVLHTDSKSTIKTTSDGQHASALRTGVSQIYHQPLGKGSGTAGPASIYNHGKERNAESFFVQIGQETGWLGLFIFIVINLGVGYLLWLKRRDPLAVILFASLIGLSFVNILSFAWSDDTLAYVWWGLAGMAMVSLPVGKLNARKS